VSDVDERPDEGEDGSPPGMGGLFTLTAEAEVIRSDQNDKEDEEAR
jgi:hypothetical protein